MAGPGKGTGKNCEDSVTEEVTFELDLVEWVGRTCHAEEECQLGTSAAVSGNDRESL